jgi:hypothetical protein
MDSPNSPLLLRAFALFPSRRWLCYPAFVLAPLLLLAAVEKVGRNFPRLMPPRWQRMQSAIRAHDQFNAIPDEEIGFLRPPGPGTDGRGFPNNDPWPEHASIVFLGDSMLTTGVELPWKFPSLVGQLLPDQPVVNLGLDGAGVERQIPLFQRFGVPLRPRIVVSCLYLSSDFDNDARFRAWRRDGRGTFFEYRMPGQSEYASPFELMRRGQWGRLLDKSWIYAGAREQATRWFGDPDALEERYRFPDGIETYLSPDSVAFSNVQTDPDDPRIDALMQSLDRLRALVSSQNATLVVALIPSFEELFRSRPESDAGNVMAHTRDRLEAGSFQVLDLYPPLRAGGQLQTPYLIKNSHLNAYGNHIVAHAMVAWFQQHPAL